MKCKVCGSESGKYPLCRACNIKKEKGEIFKCCECGNWHYVSAPCSERVVTVKKSGFLYEAKKTLLSPSEQGFFRAILSAVPEGFCVFPQINLASFIERMDDARFRNELFRNVDFLITDAAYCPRFIIEINDQTHMTADRRERDEKVQKICEEAGIPILKLWTSYGINPDYIKGRIEALLQSLPVERVHHFNQVEPLDAEETHTPPIPHQVVSVQPFASKPSSKKGCYVATAIYGSYDCPHVWVLRRFRDTTLSASWCGRVFIRVYYAISPSFVKVFGNKKWFNTALRNFLDSFVVLLQKKGFADTPYHDS